MDANGTECLVSLAEEPGGTIAIALGSFPLADLEADLTAPPRALEGAQPACGRFPPALLADAVQRAEGLDRQAEQQAGAALAPALFQDLDDER